jgi:hypothetical protein
VICWRTSAVSSGHRSTKKAKSGSLVETAALFTALFCELVVSPEESGVRSSLAGVLIDARYQEVGLIVASRVVLGSVSNHADHSGAKFYR